MLLVDTSFFIEYFKGSEGSEFTQFTYLMDQGVPCGINTHIYQELLQGTRNDKEYSLLKEYLSSLPFFELKHGQRSIERAAILYKGCRARGVTVKCTIDILIAQIALEHGLVLLHRDRDFMRIGEVVPELKLFSPIQFL